MNVSFPGNRILVGNDYLIKYIWVEWIIQVNHVQAPRGFILGFIDL